MCRLILMTAVPVLTFCLLLSGVAVAQHFVDFQDIPTNGARELEVFTVDGDSYLAVANYSSNSSTNTDSKIYQWEEGAFTECQSIPTSGASDWEFFTIGTDLYLAVSNYFNGSTRNIDSKIYKWNGSSFAEFQSIPTNGAFDWEFFTIGTDSYLVVANNYDDSSPNIDSKVYRWSGSSFLEFQSIPTNGADDWEFFTIGTDSYLAVANSYNGSSYNTDSKIYRWMGSSFVEYQSIPTSGAFDWEFFAVGMDSFLAVANDYNGTTMLIDSKIYRWNGSAFVEYQSIPTGGANDWEFFTIGQHSYLAVANSRGPSYSTDSRTYRWEDSTFVEYQAIATRGAQDWEFLTIDGIPYLAVANFYDGSYEIDSKVFMQDEPVIEAIEDIGNDQGGAVRITVRRSGRDRLGSATPVLQYEVYRRIDPLPLGHSREASTGSMLSDPGTLLQGWDYVGAFPAHLEPHYYTVAPTLADSTISNGMHWSVFFVRAATADPGVFVDSEPDSGYSLDNLAPAAPPAFNMTSPTELAWEEVSDEDFNYYAVYGSEGPAMDGSETLIGFTTDIQMDVTGSVFAYYHVTAFDFSGNEGDASTLENTHAGVSAGSLPTEYALMQNLPNPFDAATSIRFDLPGASHVRLIVFDVEGRGVVKLTDGVWEAGQHSVVWGGDDSDGKPASPGLYFVRMEAPGFVDTKKMILMR